MPEKVLTKKQKRLKESLIKNWPSAVVARAQFHKFSGGAFSPGTVANADAAGDGIERITKKGCKTIYLTPDAADWLVRRLLPSHEKTKPDNPKNQAIPIKQ